MITGGPDGSSALSDDGKTAASRCAIIGDIGRYALHDGPGIRTTVFFKGCPMHCPWCHNPEFIRPQPEMLFYAARCMGCGDCAAVCPEGAVDLRRPERIDRRRCTVCGQCARICPTRALVVAGKAYDVAALTAILLRDWPFYLASGGGVTLSGGEPTLQMAFMGQLLRRLKREGLHTVLETSGGFAMDALGERCLANIDLIYYDLKISDPVHHRRIIGVDNQRIWSNLEILTRRAPEKVVPRIPLIPGYTATRENLCAIAGRLRDLGLGPPVLLPYHPFGLSKQAHVGRPMDATLPKTPMATQELEKWTQFIESGCRSGRIGKEVNHAD